MGRVNHPGEPAPRFRYDTPMTVIELTEIPTGRYRFSQVARMEWIKVRSLRSTWWTLTFTVVAAIGIAAAVGAQTKAHTADVTNNILGGVAPGLLLTGVLGVLVMTSEYTSGLIRTTFTAAPKRSLVLIAKAAVFGAVSLVVGEIASFSAFFAGTTSLPRTIASPALSQPKRAAGRSSGRSGLLSHRVARGGPRRDHPPHSSRGRRPRGWGLCRGNRTRWAFEIGWELRAGQHRRQLPLHHAEVASRLVAVGGARDAVPVRRPRPRHRRVASRSPRCVNFATTNW